LCAALVFSALAGLAVVACEGDDVVLRSYDPYEGGTPYPDLRPKLAFPVGDFGLVSNNGSDSVSVLDLVHSTVLGSAPVGRDPVTNDGPHHIAADRSSGFAYVALAYPVTAGVGPHASHGSSVRPGWVQKLALDDLRVVGEVRVDTNPGDIVLSEDASRLVVSHFDLLKAQADGGVDDKRATLAVIDPQALGMTGSPDPVRRIVCAAPHGVTLSRPNGAKAYVACYGEDAMAIVDLDDPQAPVTRVPVGASPGALGSPVYGPYSAVLSHDGKRIAIGDTESKDLRFFDVTTGAMEPLVVPSPGAVYFTAWSPDDTRLYVPTQARDTLQVVNASTGAVVTARELDRATCFHPHEAMLSTDGATLYVVCEGDLKTPSVVVALDPTTLATRSSFPVGIYPDRLLVLRGP
jgi:DNA-binding beta-propeller fold protein YncE